MTLLERIGNPWEKARAAKSVLVQVIDSAPYHIVSTTLDVLDGVLQSDIASGASFRAEVDAPSCRDYITKPLLTAAYCLSMMLQSAEIKGRCEQRNGEFPVRDSESGLFGKFGLFSLRYRLKRWIDIIGPYP
jgi:hypothetical protein